ncbi:glutathione S-transferase 2 [Helicoverpa armigera]|uniref:glutathione S-transferase 2 n=1 Tax=Helicoverpa armigera TaxID=29058 RepID=UPI003082F29E
MPKYVITYFNGKGVAESSRLLMAYGGEEFEDRRVSFQEWPELKPKTLFGALPTLDIDGQQYAQSVAISRYFGHKHGLAGDTLEDALEIDQMVDYIMELRVKLSEVHYEADEAVKEAKYAERMKEVFPTYLERFNSIITKNNGHLALGKLTWADFFFAGIFGYLKTMLRMPDLEKKYPAFKQVVDTVYSLPKVKAFTDAIPKPDFNY